MIVTIDQTTERRLWALIRSVKTEIGGWGYAWLQEDGTLLWDEVFLVPQVVTQSEVDFEETAGDTVAIEKAVEDGVLDKADFVWVSWHSHHTMKPFWSKTDGERINALNKTGITRLLSFVGCHDESYEMRLDLFGVEAHGVNVGQVTISNVELGWDPDDEFNASILREVATNVRKPPKQQVKNFGLKPAGSAAKLSKQQPTEDRKLNVNEAFAVNDMMKAGFTYAEALNLLEDIGVTGANNLLDDGLEPDAMLGKAAWDNFDDQAVMG